MWTAPDPASVAVAVADPQRAAARGVPVGLLSLAFMLLRGLTVAMSVQVVGALLVLSVICTPAAAPRVTATPGRAAVLSVVFAEVAVLGGIRPALAAAFRSART